MSKSSKSGVKGYLACEILPIRKTIADDNWLFFGPMKIMTSSPSMRMPPTSALQVMMSELQSKKDIHSAINSISLIAAYAFIGADSDILCDESTVIDDFMSTHSVEMIAVIRKR